MTHSGRLCYKRQKINLSQVFAGQNVGVKQVSDRIWLVTFMDYDLGYFDDEICRLEPVENPFGPKVLPMSPEWTKGGGVPTGIRTRVSALKGPRPRPLDDGDEGGTLHCGTCARTPERRQGARRVSEAPVGTLFASTPYA